jgi:iron complex outermembrane receptor protein
MRRHLLPMLLLSCAVPLRATAQTPDEATVPSAADTLDTVRVVGTPRSLAALPGSAAVLDRAALRDGQREVNLSEALQRVPGFTALDRGNYAQDLQIQSRGFGARSTFGIRGIRLVVDGIPSSAADGQGQAAAFPLSSLDRIEVLRGPLALQYGNAAGGAIVGESVLDAPPGVEFEGWAGSHGSRRIGARIDGGDAGDAWRWRGALSSFAIDGARPHSAARRHQFNAIAEWSDRPERRLRLVANGLRLPQAQDPLGLTREAFDRDPDGTDPVAQRFDTRKTVREDQLGIDWRSAPANGPEWRIVAYRTAREVEQFLSIPPTAQTAASSAGGVIDLRRDSGGVDAGLRWRGARGGFGLGIEAARLEEVRRGYENYVGSVATPTLGVRGRLRRDERNRMDLFDVYATGDLSFAEHWTALLGVRRSWLRIDSRDRFLANGDDSGDRRDARSAWSLGAVRAFARGEVFASVGEGFETPTLNEQAYRPDGSAGLNRGLEPARTRAVEIGTRWRGARHQVSFALYRVDGRDEIVPALNRGGRASFANAGATRREGAELGLSGDISGPWRYALAASWTDARFVEDFVFVAQGETRRVAAGNRMPGIPRGDLFAELQWRSDDARWSAALESRALGAIAVDDRNSDAASGHARFALRGEWRAKTSGWHAFARIDNLFDRDAAGSVIVNEANGRFFEPAAGRAFTFGFGWRDRSLRD